MEVLVLVSTFIFTGKTTENSVCVNFCFKFLGVNWYMTVIIVLDSVILKEIRFVIRIFCRMFLFKETKTVNLWLYENVI